MEPHGPEKIPKIFRSRCLDGVATTNIAINYKFVAWIHGHVVAPDLSRAQLCLLYSSFTRSLTKEFLAEANQPWVYRLLGFFFFHAQDWDEEYEDKEYGDEEYEDEEYEDEEYGDEEYEDEEYDD